MENALIVFVTNTDKGKVKPRLAEALGDDKTIEVYKHLLSNTRDMAVSCNCSHFVFYSSYVHVQDMFDDDLFTKFVQEGDTLKERTFNAFKKVFGLGCKRVCLVKGDCYAISPATIEQSFDSLLTHDAVIGPTSRGDYYLLGIKEINEKLFEDYGPQTGSALDDIINRMKMLDISFAELDELNDIETIEDLLKTDILTSLGERS